MGKSFALMLALGLTGCTMVNRHDYFEPIPEHGWEASFPVALPITRSNFYFFGILFPVFPFYSRPSPLIVELGLPSDPYACPPIRIGWGGMARDTVQATSVSSRGCLYECERQAPDFLELDWAGRTFRIGFHRKVDWSYLPFFLPTH